MTRTGLILSCAALAACAHHELDALHRTPLHVEDHEGAAMPLVHATLAGRDTWLIFDTGATQSMAPIGFVKASGLRPKKYGNMYGGSSNYQTILQVIPDVPVQFEGEAESSSMDFLFGSFLPDGMGLFAPQSLVSSGQALTIDMVNGELRYDPEDVALRRLREAGLPVREVAFRHCKNEGWGDKAHRLVEIAVNGVPSWVLLDTGSTRTALTSDNLAIDSMKGTKNHKSEFMDFTSSRTSSLKVDDIPVTFAGTTLKLQTTLLPSSSLKGRQEISCGQGALGADFLRHCRIVWGSSSLWASCRAREGEAR
jgi:hypothetical protein